jgi:hypothetical protein
MKKIIYTYVMVLSFLLGSIVDAKADAKRLSVVELFTSQGCSSCPPADAFLGELAMRSDVLALAYHVDYWDYIGWKDIYARSGFTDRQRNYARQFDLRYVYTPQMIVGGAVEASGNERRRLIKAVDDDVQLKPDLSLTITPQNVTLRGDTQGNKANVYHVSFHEEVKTDVRRGENRGKILIEYHVVDGLVLLGTFQGGEAHFDVSTNDLDLNLGHAIFVQEIDSLHILAGFRIK